MSTYVPGAVRTVRSRTDRSVQRTEVSPCCYARKGHHDLSCVCRLMHFDVETLYELHYQMITLGKVSTYLPQLCCNVFAGKVDRSRGPSSASPNLPDAMSVWRAAVQPRHWHTTVQVFCTKRNPNCTACPLRHECDYALANGQHLQPGLVRPKKAAPRPKQPASRATAMLALPSADSATAAGMHQTPTFYVGGRSAHCRHVGLRPHPPEPRYAFHTCAAVQKPLHVQAFHSRL